MQSGHSIALHPTAPSPFLPSCLRVFTLLILLGNTLSADRFRGQVRHEFLENQPVGGAQLEMVDAADPTQTATVITDALGYFGTDAFDAGDEVNITATHPAYAQETPTVTLGSADHFESILMTPLGDVTTDYHDVMVQISGAVTQLPLRNVPVEITRWDESNNVVGTFNLTTDAKGVAVLRGARSGFYEFKINDSSLPDADRNPRYEDYATPFLGRVEITKNHFTNVFLKPLKQDLRVLVTGYNFETEEDAVPLGEVLVEIRGLDPHDTDVEVLHPRSDYTKLFPPGPTPTITDDEILISDGEVAFMGLPPAAYEVKIARYGYITQRIILEPDAVTGLLANSLDNPLEVYLQRESHVVDILIDYEDYDMAEFGGFGQVVEGGVTGLGLTVRVVGLEGTNTEGLSYEGITVQNLNGETYAPFDTPFLPGRYRVFVDGMSQEQPVQYNEQFDFFQTVGEAFDVGATGESILEIPPGYVELFPERHRHRVTLETQEVSVRGRLMSAEAIEREGGQPIFQPHANQTIELVSNPTDTFQKTPTTVTTTTDADGRFTARVLPGLYGIRLPGMTDYFGDEVIVTVTAAARSTDANRTRSYEWPLAEAFPDVAGATSSQIYRYFEEHGIPVHDGREQFFELRVRRESYVIQSSGTEQTDLNQKMVAITPDGSTYSVNYSPTLAAGTEITLEGSGGNFTIPIAEASPDSFSDQLIARWENLPPGDYTGITATIPAHDFDASFWNAQTFIDWPEPGAAPAADLAVWFYANTLPSGQLPWEPLVPAYPGTFEITMTPYAPATYSVYVWDTREVNDEEVTKYFYSNEGSGGSPMETTLDSGYFGGFAELGGPVTATWTTGRNEDGDTYPVRMTPGGSLFLGGPSATPETPLPVISYSLQLDGVAASDQNLTLDGANYTMGSSGRTLQTGSTLAGLQEEPYVYKSGGDNFYEQFQSRVRIVSAGASPTLGITVGLEQGMQVDATVKDMTPVGTGGDPIDIPAPGIPVEIRNRYGRVLQTITTDDEGKVSFQALPGYADYFLTIESSGYVPVRRRLPASEATTGTEGSTVAMHDIAQDVVLLDRPTLHAPGVPHNRWGLFLPTVSRSGDVKAEDDLNTFDFFAAREALTTTWKVEVVPHQLSVALPGFDNPDGTPGESVTVSGPDAIVAAYLIDERRFQKDGFVGGTDPLENEELFDIPPDDEPAQLAGLLATIRETTKIQGQQNGFTFSTKKQRRVFVDPADTIAINNETGRTVVTGTMPIWDLPPGEFDPVIVLETQRGAYRVYDVPYEGADANKRLRGPELPPWFAGILDLLGIASGVASTQGRLEESFKEYVPEGSFIPLPDFSATVTVDKENDDVDEGYLQYAFTLAMEQEVGQDSKADGLLALGTGLIGAKTKVEGKLTTDGKANATAFTLSGSITKENLIDEAYGTKIAPIGGSTVSFENPTGMVSTTASTNYPIGASEQDPLKFSLSATAGIGVTAKVSANLNNYGRAIPYAGPVIGFLGDSGAAKLDAFVEGRAAVTQSYTLETEFPRERKLRTRERSAAVPRQSFLGENKIELKPEQCFGIGFGTGLEFTSSFGAEANLKYDIGGGGCGVSDDIGTMELKFNPTGGWPFITEISGEAKITAEASAGAGPAQIKGEWEFAKVEFKVQFGTDTIVTHYPIDTEFLLAGDLASGEGIFQSVGPDLVGGFAPAADYAVSGPATETFAYTAYNEALGIDVLRIAQRLPDGSWEDATEIELAPQIGVSTSLTLGDRRTLIAYTVIADGEDPYDPYADHQVFSRIIETDGTVGPQTYVAYINNPPTELVLAESGSLVELHLKAPATDGTQHFWQLFLTPFDPATSTWGSTAFRVNETEDFDLHVAAGGPTGADEIVAHWVLKGSGTWKWLRSADSTPQSVSGTFAGAPATWATAAFYDIVIPLGGGGIQEYGQTALTGTPSAQSVLVEDVPAVEVGLTQQSVAPDGGFLLSWVENRASRQELSYLTYNPQGEVVAGPLPITQNSRGSYADIRLTRINATSAQLLSRFTNDDFSSLRTFEITVEGGVAGNDSDGDTLPDAAELRIVDADPEDVIRTIADVLDGDDFDQDGVTNGDEIRAGSDPIDPNSSPTPPEIAMHPADTTVNAGEAAQFTVIASGEGLTYEWRHNGFVLPSATGSTLTVNSANTADAGIYDVTVRSSTGGAIRSEGARLAVNGGDNLPSIVSGALGTTELADNDLAHVPFRVDGSGPKRMLFRALGPLINSVSDSGQSTVGDPWLMLRDRTGAMIAGNDDWEDATDSGTEAQSASTAVGAIPLVAGGLDAALVTELSPGNYTLETGATGPGSIYIEIFDLDDSAMPVSRIASLGVHSHVTTDGTPPTLGFTVSEPGNRDLVSRYLGPALGSAAPLANPSLDLFTGGTPSTLVGSNDDWETGNLPAGLAGLLRGIPLPIGGTDAARIDRLAAGTYLLNASVASGEEGSGMLELIDPLSTDSPDQIAVLIPARDLSIPAGATANFGVLAVGPATLSYQWKLADQNVPGATATSLEIPDVQVSDEGAYTVVITDGNATLTTAPVTLNVLGGGPVRAAQSADPLAIPPGGTTTVTVQIEWDETPANLTYTTPLPTDWTLQSHTATGTSAAPADGATGELVWTFDPPAGDPPLSFTFTAEVPADAPGPVELYGEVSHEPTPGNVVTSEALPHPLRLTVTRGSHDADTDGDFRINLSELLRVIELYNTRFGTTRTGAYRVQDGTDDGFNPDATVESPGPLTRYHSADTDRDGKLSLSELLRVIELYNTRNGTTRTGAYRAADGTSDGFEPDPNAGS